MPATTKPRRIGTKNLDRYPFLQSFSHDAETAEPGYYSVVLQESSILVELTSTANAGIHRYTFPSGTPGRWIIFDVGYTIKYRGAAVSQISIDSETQEVSGYVLNMGEMSSRFGGMTVYFSALFSESFTQYGAWDDSGIFKDGKSFANGTEAGGYIGFPPSVGSAEMYVGISFISVEQARENVKSQLPSATQSLSSFDLVKQQAQAQWEALLGTVEIVNAGPLAQGDDTLTVFYINC